MFGDNHILFSSFNITSTRNHLQHIKKPHLPEKHIPTHDGCESEKAQTDS